MRALKVGGLIVFGLWMTWITVRVEMAMRLADHTCKAVYFGTEGNLPQDSCAVALLRAPLVNRIPIPDRNSN